MPTKTVPQPWLSFLREIDGFVDELRVYLGNPEREDLTLKLWLEMIQEDRKT